MTYDLHSWPSFGGLPGEYTQFEIARVIVLPVPYEQTTTFLKGTADGPRAILEASTQVEFYDDVLGREPYRVGIHTLPPLDVSGPPEAVIARIEERIAALPADRLIVMLGGEHAITAGAIRAVHKQYPDVGFLALDAHDDLRDEYEGSRLNHACASRRASDLCPVVQVGIRSVSPDGAKIARRYEGPQSLAASRQARGNKGSAVQGVADSGAASSGFRKDRPSSSSLGPGTEDLGPDVLTVPAHYIAHHGMPTADILAALPERVYLSVDIDAFDPAYCPGVGTPEPGGLDWYQVTDLIAAVAESREIVAFDVNEVRPLPGQAATEFLAAKLIYRTIGLITG